MISVIATACGRPSDKEPPPAERSTTTRKKTRAMARRRHQARDLSARRKSVAYFPPEGPDRFSYGDLYLLSDDINTHIISSGSSSHTWPDYRIDVEPFSQAAEECLVAAISVHEREYDLTSAVAEFIKWSAGIILYQGEAFFEVVFDDDEHPKSFLLAPLPPGKVTIDSGMVIQSIPSEVQTVQLGSALYRTA